jgi:hypothetical protein
MPFAHAAHAHAILAHAVQAHTMRANNVPARAVHVMQVGKKSAELIKFPKSDITFSK